MTYLSDFISLLFPNLCLACSTSLLPQEKILCTACYFKLPKTKFHAQEDNDVIQMFWGRVKLEGATALLFYSKGGTVQKMLHDFKYRGNRGLGIFLGQELGSELKKLQPYCLADMIIPVPLHPRKKRKRGFNQAEIFADGISEVMKIPVITNILKRRSYSKTQTRKSRFLRWKNVEQIFIVKDTKALENKHILLVDDVITTGATLESCCIQLSKAENIQISILSAAFTKK